MDIKQQLEQVLEGPIRDPEDAERAKEAADLLAQLLRLERRVEGLLHGERRGVRSLAGMTLHDAAERVLEEAGMPLHARELGARIKARGWSHPRSKTAKPWQIIHQLAARLPKKPETFRRIAPQTFALIRWGDDPFPARGIRPRLGLFRGPGTGIAASTADSDAPITDRSAEWRSS